ncbi:TetR/AcrR family transcriptional regulator [Pseudorhodoferax sp.]|uniref:TetR/AcrR family transcriptional regulator n=1 Tax=Pseudorhodoferax sp. TaxID=1993553 RepID=UPI0039E29B48
MTSLNKVAAGMEVTSVESRSRNAERTQRAILDAALQAFATTGFAGTRLDHIADAAKIDKRLIYYYFKNKEGLFLAVLEDAYRGIREAESKLDLDALGPIEAIRKLVEFSWSYYLAHPEFVTLINSENLHRARHLEKSTLIRDINSPLIDTLGKILEKGRSQGVFRGGVDPLQLYISIVGLTYFYLSNQHTLSLVFGRNLMATKALNERLSHVVEYTLGYLVRE